MKNLLTILLLLAGTALTAQEKGVTPVTTPHSALATPHSTRAVVIGISDYQDKDIPDLRFADKDAEAFANFLRSTAGGSLDGDHLKVLLNKEATMAQFANALDWLWEVTKEGDQAIIYFSGHGDVEKKSLTQPGFLLCWDAPARVYMGGGAFALPMLQEVISTLSIQNKAKVVVITDACRSGTLAGQSVGGAQATAANLAKQYANEIKILSCQPNEYSIEGEQWGGGRGAFSFNLVDALYGMADGNNDLFVSLQEVGRYLEDHVTAEVAPVSQVPMVLGNRMERLASVDAQLLTDLRSGKTSQMQMLSPVEMRGMEDEVLAGTDTTVRELYRLFKKALKNKVFLEPSDACADVYYERLMAEPKLARLHSTMRRNYAAALQDDAQQTMNTWMSADDIQQLQRLEKYGKNIRLEPIPRHLQRAAELLGESHYMYRPLLARKLLFEGILLRRYYLPDAATARQCLQLFGASLELEPQSALPWYWMVKVYAGNLRQLDSAFICARQTRELVPNWVLPFYNLFNNCLYQNQMEKAKEALMEMDAMSPHHPYVLDAWARWYAGRGDDEKALALYEQYRDNGGRMYISWYSNLGRLLAKMGRHSESDATFFNAIALDSTAADAWGALAVHYWQTGRQHEAETAFLKSTSLDSTNLQEWQNLASFYLNTQRSAEAQSVLEKVIALNSGVAHFWTSLGDTYFGSPRYAEAEQAYKNSVALDSTFAYGWTALGDFYTNVRRFAEAEVALKKGISFDSTWLYGWRELGNMYKDARRYAEAEQVFQKTIEMGANDSYSWSTLGALYVQAGRYTEAEPILIKALGIDPKNYHAYRYLGLLYLKTNHLDDARQNILKALELNAIQSDSYYVPAQICMTYLLVAEGKTEEAIGYVEQAISKGSTFEQLESDEDLAPLRSLPEWKALMKKYFLDKVKD